MSSLVTLTTEQYDALLAGCVAAVLERDEVVNQRNALPEERANLRTELRVVTTERDLYHERLKLFQRRLFAAKSEARNPHQRDLFFNEPEVLASGTDAAQKDSIDGKVEGGAHKRTRRDRHWLDPALPRVTVRYDLSEAERTCEHDGSRLVQIDVRVREQLVHLGAHARQYFVEAEAHPLCRPRSVADVEQLRQHDQAVGRRPQGVVICRHGTRREDVDEPVFAHRNVQGQWRRAVCVSETPVHGAAASADGR